MIEITLVLLAIMTALDLAMAINITLKSRKLGDSQIIVLKKTEEKLNIEIDYWRKVAETAKIQLDRYVEETIAWKRDQERKTLEKSYEQE